VEAAQAETGISICLRIKPAGLPALSSIACAQVYPSRPVRIVSTGFLLVA